MMVCASGKHIRTNVTPGLNLRYSEKGGGGGLGLVLN